MDERANGRSGGGRCRGGRAHGAVGGRAPLPAVSRARITKGCRIRSSTTRRYPARGRGATDLSRLLAGQSLQKGAAKLEADSPRGGGRPRLGCAPHYTSRTRKRTPAPPTSHPPFPPRTFSP